MNDPTTEDALPLEQEDEAIVQLRDAIGGWLVALQLEGVQPMVAAGQLFDVLVQVVGDSMGKGAIRTALLMTYEKTFPQPMTFRERDDAKKLLDQVSNLRRKIEGKPHLVLPGAGDGE
jgi:hypothetical protein